MPKLRGRWWVAGWGAGRGRESPPPRKIPHLLITLSPRRAVRGITIPRADAGRMSSFPLHSQAECTRIQRRGGKHNKFRLQVRVPAGAKLEDEQWRLDGRRVRACSSLKTGYILEKRKKTRQQSFRIDRFGFFFLAYFQQILSKSNMFMCFPQRCYKGQV